MPLTQDPGSALDATDRPDRATPANAPADPADALATRLADPAGALATRLAGALATRPVGIPGNGPADAPAKLIFGLVAVQLGVRIAAFTPIVLALALRAAQIVPEIAAKDVGVPNIAHALPQYLVPMLAPFVLAVGGRGNHGALFLVGGIAAAAGAALVQLIRSVK